MHAAPTGTGSGAAAGVRIGARVAAIVAATTIGSIVGLGLRHGSALDPFTLAGHALVTSLGYSWLATAIGLVLHLLWVGALGVSFGALASRRTGLGLAGAALLVAAAGWLVARLLPIPFRIAAGGSLDAPERIFLYIVIAVTLAIGVRFIRG